MFCRRLQELEEETSALKRQLLSAPSTSPANSLPNGDAPPLRLERRNEPSTDNDPTLSRSIDGLELAPSIIDDCFEL